MGEHPEECGLALEYLSRGWLVQEDTVGISQGRNSCSNRGLNRLVFIQRSEFLQIAGSPWFTSRQTANITVLLWIHIHESAQWPGRLWSIPQPPRSSMANLLGITQLLLDVCPMILTGDTRHSLIYHSLPSWDANPTTPLCRTCASLCRNLNRTSGNSAAPDGLATSWAGGPTRKTHGNSKKNAQRLNNIEVHKQKWGEASKHGSCKPTWWWRKHDDWTILGAKKQS